MSVGTSWGFRRSADNLRHQLRAANRRATLGVRMTVSGKKQVKYVIAQYSEAISDGLVKIVGSTARQIRSGAERRAPMGIYGNVKAGIFASKVRKGKRSVSARVISSAPYSSAVEFGGWKQTKRKIAFKQPPSRAFIPYVERYFALSGTSAEAAAYRVARKVAMEGIEKRPFLGPAYVEVRPRYYSRVYQLVKSEGPALATRRVKRSLVTSLVE